MPCYLRKCPQWAAAWRLRARYRLFQVIENEPPDRDETVASAVPEEDITLIPTGLKLLSAKPLTAEPLKLTSAPA